jgi:hypothetical protein
MEVLTIAIVGLLCITCLVIGAKLGQTTVKGEKIELPKINPIQTIKESKARKEVERQQDKLNTVLRNIERYDGTSRGQEDVR